MIATVTIGTFPNRPATSFLSNRYPLYTITHLIQHKRDTDVIPGLSRISSTFSIFNRWRWRCHGSTKGSLVKPLRAWSVRCVPNNTEKVGRWKCDRTTVYMFVFVFVIVYPLSRELRLFIDDLLSNDKNNNNGMISVASFVPDLTFFYQGGILFFGISNH